ncbi:conjugal transfer protein TraN [Vibrio sp. 10N.286.48.B7]|uniref:conjugal transfer protein TraN n=1 Tax=Vibrio sp. 10N.286.48.B7 TaxID=1880853 RepID=UPI0039A57B93
MRWTTHCNLLSECQVVSQTCVEGRGTRRIHGVPTTLDCWKYQVNHQCSRDNTCNALPTGLHHHRDALQCQTKRRVHRGRAPKSCPQEALQHHQLNLWRKKVFVSTVIAMQARLSPPVILMNRRRL